ncbi:MAG TPA: pyridoxine 5'-phosphate synthase [Deltaproteobacteria bacterium]|nr:MAG: pyridoxine 5'-phosphate synthase [Deltaproteobacteria bacterium GWA2_55_82]OGQ63729.1 MAG: pyridoxine 5'-phosphate synthase [Deltaproteobacteria bacterium RIFCSPLOWO2_02_FULL_55_12]OIJ73452.1 MAG: pyridoxine 5'-phosphate synthase [Deltaproteobacteria bacterium GWC2_55_46]HBG47317.1 pyridoxine 5'-phosphate synthase [Deltaproteobacteria bacterium]HCY10083.1 pyridoxine 5'-phosphate synthase [Deltaproteobacteria bacterium]
MAKLSVNVDHVATVRQARLATEPDPVSAAVLAELAGADGITVHLREDRRHIQDRDVQVLRRTVKTELNLEMAATKEMLESALEIKPDMVTLVPEKRQELTTEGGLDVKTHLEHLKRFVGQLKDAGIRVNLFVDPSPEAVKACHRIGSDGVELHTGTYAESKEGPAMHSELKRIYDSAIFSRKLGLKTHAGHGLDYGNIIPVASIREIDEFAIGFSIIARSIYTGIGEAVREMKRLIIEAR